MDLECNCPPLRSCFWFPLHHQSNENCEKMRKNKFDKWRRVEKNEEKLKILLPICVVNAVLTPPVTTNWLVAMEATKITDNGLDCPKYFWFWVFEGSCKIIILDMHQVATIPCLICVLPKKIDSSRSEFIYLTFDCVQVTVM